jgi:nitrogen regulatory protein PII
VRPWRLDKVAGELRAVGIRGMTVSEVRGAGVQGGVAPLERYEGTEFGAAGARFLVAKVRAGGESVPWRINSNRYMNN